ncbi:hypothetical protein EDB19DRAFT_2027092 [Suillus lakei]|nr:hypothetical protein EDB19DRAFT_2027092 [Suillus lakei]
MPDLMTGPDRRALPQSFDAWTLHVCTKQNLAGVRDRTGCLKLQIGSASQYHCPTPSLVIRSADVHVHANVNTSSWTSRRGVLTACNLGYERIRKTREYSQHKIAGKNNPRVNAKKKRQNSDEQTATHTSQRQTFHHGHRCLALIQAIPARREIRVDAEAHREEKLWRYGRGGEAKWNKERDRDVDRKTRKRMTIKVETRQK